jgi:hypothetical protein
MLIYRIQNDKNMGPMSCDSPIRHNVKHHKSPCEMQGVKNGKPVKPQIVGTTGRFAWDSLDAVCGFIKYPRAVDDNGYNVVVYEVNEAEVVRYPDGQVLFYMEDATPVKSFKYSEATKIRFGGSLL